MQVTEYDCRKSELQPNKQSTAQEAKNIAEHPRINGFVTYSTQKTFVRVNYKQLPSVKKSQNIYRFPHLLQDWFQCDWFLSR